MYTVSGTSRVPLRVLEIVTIPVVVTVETVSDEVAGVRLLDSVVVGTPVGVLIGALVGVLVVLQETVVVSVRGTLTVVGTDRVLL